MTTKTRLLGLSTVFMLTAVTGAEAHVGAGAVHGTVAGFLHPIGGLDHILAMVAVGVLAVQQAAAGRDNKALWLLPLSFVAMMMVGGVMGVSGIGLPFVELGIMGSVVVLGSAVALGRAMPLPAAMALVGALSVFHGFAHGTEMPVDASGVLYGAGFVAATGILHMCGIGATVSAQKFIERAAPVAMRILGGVMAAIGMMMLAGA